MKMEVMLYKDAPELRVIAETEEDAEELKYLFGLEKFTVTWYEEKGKYDAK